MNYREIILLFVALLIGVECNPALKLELSRDEIGNGISVEISGKTETKIKLRPSNQQSNEDSKGSKEVDGIISIITAKPSNIEQSKASNEKLIEDKLEGIIDAIEKINNGIQENNRQNNDGKINTNGRDDSDNDSSGDSSESVETYPARHK